jgi:hypothetical protein
MPSKQAAKKQTGYTTIPLDTVGEDETSTSTPAIHAEEDPTHLPVGVSIQNLVKVLVIFLSILYAFVVQIFMYSKCNYIWIAYVK